MEYINTKVKIADLKPNFLVKELEIPVNKLHSEFAKMLQYYDKPVISEDNIVLTHWESVLSARKNELVEIEVIKAVGLDSNYYIPFISFDYVFKEKSTLCRYHHLTALREYIKDNPVGKKWRGTVSVNDFLAEKMGVDIETIKLYNRIVKRTLEIGRPADYFFKLGIPITHILPKIERMKMEADATKDSTKVNINPNSQLLSFPSLQEMQPTFSNSRFQILVQNRIVEFEASDAILKGNKLVYNLILQNGLVKSSAQLIIPIEAIQQEKDNSLGKAAA